MFRKRNQKVRLWWGPVGRPHCTAHVIHSLLLFFSEFVPKNIKKPIFQSILPTVYFDLFLTDESTEEEAP